MRSLGFEAENEIGIQTRYDDIRVGLFNTCSARRSRPCATTRSARQRRPLRREHHAAGPTGCADRRRARRLYWAPVDSDTPANSGAADGIHRQPEGWAWCSGRSARPNSILNAGCGFHSNDVRGATITVDPTDTVTPPPRVPLLVRSKGAEIGVAHQGDRRASSSRSRCSCST